MKATVSGATDRSRTGRYTLSTMPPHRQRSFAEEVERGLRRMPKKLPSRFFYDARGSAIFEEICHQPEYYLTRCEREILQKHADEIASATPPEAELVELGSGSAEKTQLLIEAFLRRNAQLCFVPVDISRSALEQSAEMLLERYEGLSVHAFEAEYEAGIARLKALDSQPVMVAWLGSSIGNLTRDEAASFLARVGRELQATDRLLIGIDLRKDAETLEAAYNDAGGVTARFNRNLLERINRELDGHFAPEHFAFRAHYREDVGVVESHLVSREEQWVEIGAIDGPIHFAAGESIHTEDSVKYSQSEIDALAAASGLVREREWRDSAGRFSLSLFAPDEG